VAITRPQVRLRRWLVTIGLGLLITLGGLLVLVRVKFEGPDLGDSLGAMLSQNMRGRVAIGSVDWPVGAIETAVTGGWVPVTLRDVEVWDDKDVSVLQTPRINAELDLHALMFGRHDFVIRHIQVIGGRVLLREMTEPYPLHDYDTTVFSLLAAFYGKRTVAGYYVGIQATSAPLFDLRDYHLEDIDVDIRMTPYGKDGRSYKFRALLEDVVADGFLFMDSSDPIVPKFYTSLQPRASGGQIDLFYEPRADGTTRGDYSIALESMTVKRLQQVPAGWPASPVANTLNFDVELVTKDKATIHVDGAMRDYWADAYDGVWDVRVAVANAGPMLRHAFDPDLGGDNVTVDATITGPIVAYPKIDLVLKGLTYDVTLVEPPLHLELDTLKVGFDLVVDRGQVDAFVARGAGGQLTIAGTFGGDSTNESPFKVDGEVRIDRPIDVAGRLPPCFEKAFGSKLSGHLRVSRDKGTTNLNVAVHDYLFRLGKLSITGGPIFSDIAFGKVHLTDVRAQLEGASGKVSGEIDTASGALALKGRVESGDFQGLMRTFQCASGPAPRKAAPAAVRPRRSPTPAARGARPPTVGRRDRARTAGRAPGASLVHGQPSPPAPRPPAPAPAPAPAPGKPARSTSGAIEFDIGGTIDRPTVSSTGRLDGVPFVRTLRGKVDYAGDNVDVDASSSGLGGPLRAVGRVRLAPTTVIERMRVTARKIDLGRLPEGIAGLTGKLSADLTLQGTPTVRGLDVAGWACSSRLTLAGDAYADIGLWMTRTPGVLDACGKLAPPTVAPAVHQACTAVARAGGRCVVARARREAGGELTLAGSIDRRQQLGGSAAFHGLPLAAIAALAGTALPAGGVLDTDGLALGGTLAAPELTGTIAITRAWAAEAFLGDGTLTVRGVGRGTIELDSRLLDGRVALHGTLGTVAPYPLDLTAELTQVELDTLVDVVSLGLPAGTRAWTSGRVHVRTALADPKAPLVASLELNDLSISTALPGPDGEPVSLTVRAAAPIELAFDGKEVRIVGTATFATPLGPVTVEGRAGGVTVDLSAKGRLDLVAAQPLLGAYFDQTSGTATLSARVSGFTADPRLQASLDLAAVALRLPRQDAILRVPSGRVELSDRQLSFTGMSVEVDDGFSADRPTLTVAGGVALEGLVPTRWSVIVEGELAGEMLLAVAPEAFAQASGTADVSLTLTGAGKVPKVRGELTFDRVKPLTLLPRSLRREIALTEGGLSFTTTDITFDNVGGTVDDEGRLRGIAGVVDLREGAVLGADLTASADAVPFRFGRALDLVLDVQDLRMVLDPSGGLDIGGAVTVVDGRFTQNFDLGEFLRPAPAAGPGAPPIWEAWPPLASARLAIDVDVRRFAAVSNLFNLDALGSVAITGTPRDPRLGGTIQISRGTIRLPAVRARFTRTSGTASFSPLLPLSSETIELGVTSEADYRDPSGQDHLITLRLGGSLAALTWDLGTAGGLNKAQTLTLILSGRTPEQFQSSLGNQAIGGDPTKIDPSTDSSQGYTDELVRQITADYLTGGITDTLRELSGLDVARIELNLSSFGFHVEQRLFENLGLVGDLERTARGSTLNGKVALSFREPFTSKPMTLQGSYLRKNFDDAAERDVNDFEVKLVLPLLVRRLLGL